MLLLWEHECEWTYGRRMVSEVDRDRYRQAFDGAVKKEFSNSDYVSHGKVFILDIFWARSY